MVVSQLQQFKLLLIMCVFVRSIYPGRQSPPFVYVFRTSRGYTEGRSTLRLGYSALDKHPATANLDDVELIDLAVPGKQRLPVHQLAHNAPDRPQVHGWVVSSGPKQQLGGAVPPSQRRLSSGKQHEERAQEPWLGFLVVAEQAIRPRYRQPCLALNLQPKRIHSMKISLALCGRCVYVTPAGARRGSARSFQDACRRGLLARWLYLRHLALSTSLAVHAASGIAVSSSRKPPPADLFSPTFATNGPLCARTSANHPMFKEEIDAILRKIWL